MTIMKRFETIFYSVLLVAFVAALLYGFGKAAEASANKSYSPLDNYVDAVVKEYHDSAKHAQEVNAYVADLKAKYSK